MPVIDPNSPFHIRWNCLVVLVIFYYAISVPYRIAFMGLPFGIWQPAIDLVADGILVLDLWINMHTAYLHHGELVASHSRIRKNYYKNEGKYDLLAILPIDWILALFTMASPWLVSLARIIRLVKISRFFSYFSSWEAIYSKSPGTVRVVKLLATVAIITHCVGCGWYLIAYYEGLGKDTWFYQEGLVDTDTATQYIRCVYWALTTISTVGYGDITPETNLETIFTMFVMMMGVSVYAYIIGNIASLIANFDARDTLYRHKMDDVNQYMTYRELPSDLQHRVRRSFEYLWSCNRGMDEMEFLKELSPPLRTEIALYLNRGIIEKVPLFQGCEPLFIETLVTRLKPLVIGPNEYVVRYGEIGEEMYFISKGSVAIVNERGEVVSTLEDGNFFGEVALLYTERRTSSVRALAHCHFFTLGKEDLDQLLGHYPHFAEHMHENARRNYEKAKLDLRGTLWRPVPDTVTTVEPAK